MRLQVVEDNERVISTSEQVRRWLATFDLAVGSSPLEGARGCPVLAWSASGAMALTGHPDQAPFSSPAPLCSLLTDVGEMIKILTSRIGRPVAIDPALILSGRAALLGLTRLGRTSAGGVTRLLRCRDGWSAVSLARLEDVELIPAILGSDRGAEWDALAVSASLSSATKFAELLQFFGVPAAALAMTVPRVDVPWQLSAIARAAVGLRLDGALVVDLSSLWAGPLCAQILGHAGARVVKVESTMRPDGARGGDPAFYNWLHAGHESVAVDFASTSGRQTLGHLIDAADIVIEASRPRALRQLGLAPEQLRHRRGKVWVSITGYGRRLPDRVAFGDDAAVAGGLAAWSKQDDVVFCADAIADPLTGVCAALAVTASMTSGGGHLIDLSMRDVAAAFAGAPQACPGAHATRETNDGWSTHCSGVNQDQLVLGPRLPAPTDAAAHLGAHNQAWPADDP